MNIQRRTVGGVTIFALRGQLDTGTSHEVHVQVLSALEPRGRVILDLAGVSHMTSAGLRVLLSLYRHTSNQGGALVLVGVPEEIRDIMDITGFLHFFTVCASLTDALDGFAARALA
jgi:anti-sigma B factor antagonist